MNKERVRRRRTTVSLLPSVWRLAEEVGGTRGRGFGLETIAVAYLRKLAEELHCTEAIEHLKIVKEEIKNARSQ